MGATYETISIVCFGLAAFFFVSGIVLFFTLRINRVVGYFTGRTEKKSIIRMRQEKEQKENKAGRFSYADKVQSIDAQNAQSSGVGNIQKTESVSHRHSDSMTEKLTDIKPAQTKTTVLSENNGTTVLGENNETTILGEDDLPRIHMIKNIIIIHTSETIA